jgi:hypothetical protein
LEFFAKGMGRKTMGISYPVPIHSQSRIGRILENRLGVNDE